MADLEVRLSVWDYVVVVSSLVLCAVIGLIVGRGSSTGGTAKYLLAGRNMSVLPVAFSIMATLLSAIAMAGGIGEMYMYGAQFQLLTLSSTIAKIGIAILIIPIFHQMEYVSVYEYLEKRFDRTLRLVFSALYIICNVAYLGIVLYMPALSLTTVTGIPFWVTSSAIGITCTFYCVAGGFKAVIWTDVLQAGLMFTCIVLVTIKGLLAYGDWGKAWHVSYQGGLFSLQWTEDIYTRYSVWSLCANGVVMSIKDYTTNQAGIQRFLSVKNTADAQKSMYISAGLMVMFKVLLIFLSVVVYASLSGCDPLSYLESNVESLDQILIFSIWKLLTDVPGLAGLAFAGIISGSLSTYSSYINAFATLTLEDYLKPYFPAITKTERRNIFICKFLTGVYGVLAIFISFGVPYMGGANRSYSVFVSSTAGPLSGVMCLGFFLAKANAKICKLALLLGFLPVLWIAIGSQIFPSSYRRLPFGIEECSQNYTFISPTQFPIYQDSYYLSLYHISFMWYSSIGFTITIISGWILSFIWGNEEVVDHKLLSPVTAKWLKTKGNKVGSQLEMKNPVSMAGDHSELTKPN